MFIYPNKQNFTIALQREIAEYQRMLELFNRLGDAHPSYATGVSYFFIYTEPLTRLEINFNSMEDLHAYRKRLKGFKRMDVKATKEHYYARYYSCHYDITITVNVHADKADELPNEPKPNTCIRLKIGSKPRIVLEPVYETVCFDNNGQLIPQEQPHV